MADLTKQIFPVVPDDCFPGVTSVFQHLWSVGLGNFNFALPSKHIREGAPGFVEQGPAAIIFGAFHPDYRGMMGRRVTREGVRKYVLWTSAPYQTEAAEVEARILEEELVPMAQRGAIDGILFGSRAMAQAYEYVIPGRAHWFPYPIGVAHFFEPEAKRETLGMFYPAHHRKNLYAQCLAVRRASRMLHDWKLVTNFSPPVRIPDANLEVRPWMPRSLYDAVLHEIRLNLHVTVTESFGYQVIDALGMGAPSLVSDGVFRNLFESDRVSPKTWSDCYETGRVVDFEDVTAIAAMIERLLPDPDACRALWHTQVEALRAQAEDHRRRLEILLKRLVE